MSQASHLLIEEEVLADAPPAIVGGKQMNKESEPAELRK